MKKIFSVLLTMVLFLNLTGCGNNDNILNDQNNTQTPQNKENKDNVIENNTLDDEITDDEIIEYNDEDNKPYEGEKVVVEEVINCEGCVYSYFSDDRSFGDVLKEDEYTTDINNIRTKGNKQRHNFFGFVLDDNKISKAYSCILKNNKIYCVQGSVDGSYHESNIGILNQIFTIDQCRYISDGHTYVCTDGSYNGDTKTTGYASLHYETSCTIFGSEGKTGKFSCN